MKKFWKVVDIAIQSAIIFGAALCIGVAIEGETVRPLSFILCCVVVIMQSIAIIMDSAHS